MHSVAGMRQAVPLVVLDHILLSQLHGVGACAWEASPEIALY
jgi:hypothetical protein